MQFIDLKAQYAALKDEINANIQDVLNSAAFIGGKYVKELETQLAAFTGRKHCITCANGNSVIFKGLDDTEKLKSITFPKGELTDIWVEEASEVREEDFNQLDVRLRGKGTHKQMVLTFNPVSVLHWLKRWIICLRRHWKRPL